MQPTHFILIILFSCLTGWLVIRLTFKILFWPEKPVSALGFKFQGLLPKHQPLIAQQLAEMASREFMSMSSLKEKATDPASFDKLKPEIEQHIDHFLREKLKESFPMLSMFIGDKTINQLKGAFLLELEGLFPVIMRSYLSNLEKDLDPQQLIAGKIAGFSLERSGILANKSARKLFIRLQLAAAGVGLGLGMLQALLFMLLA